MLSVFVEGFFMDHVYYTIVVLPEHLHQIIVSLYWQPSDALLGPSGLLKSVPIRSGMISDVLRIHMAVDRAAVEPQTTRKLIEGQMATGTEQTTDETFFLVICWCPGTAPFVTATPVALCACCRTMARVSVRCASAMRGTWSL